MQRVSRAFISLLVTFIFGLTIIYPFCVYTQNEFISKWRTIYIETAMSTLSHQWLATSFIPADIIDEVMKTRYESQALQADVQTQAQAPDKSIIDIVEEIVDEDEERFFALFYEIDRESFEQFIEENPEAIEDGYEAIDIDYCDDGDGETGIVTTAGDKVMAIDSANGIMIVQVEDDQYDGRLAFVKDASKVSVGVASALFSHGQFAGNIADRYDAILAINASGFSDPDGNGNGGIPYGFVKSQGEYLQGAVGGDYKIIGFDEDNQLNIGRMSDTSSIRDGVEFTPALFVDGERLIYDTAGWGLQPRSAIAQKEDLTVMLLVIDGRQTHSVGATMKDCSDIFERYDATQGANLDGGSSSVMYYKGRYITKPTTVSSNAEGRYLPDVFMVS